MDQNSVPSQTDEDIISPQVISQQVTKPSQKKIFLISFFVLFLVLFSAVLNLSSGKLKKINTEVVIPALSVRPTATPYFKPITVTPEISPVSNISSISASVMPEKIGKLAFIRNGDIYHSSLDQSVLLVKNKVPAKDKLVWSPQGNFLSWREKSDNIRYSAISLYNRQKKISFTITPGTSSSELIDYVWSPDETRLAVLIHDDKYRISIFPIDFVSEKKDMTERTERIIQIFWPQEKNLLFWGTGGITRINLDSSVTEVFIKNPDILGMKLSPDFKKIVYSAGDSDRNDLFLVNTDGTGNQSVPPIPDRIDMGTTGLSKSVLERGFIPPAVWMPQGDKLLVGYRISATSSLVGIYDLTIKSFTAIAPFFLSDNDLMVDGFRLLGTRTGVGNISQISIFTLEDNAGLAVAKVIPDASSPAFFGNDLLPSGNYF